MLQRIPRRNPFIRIQIQTFTQQFVTFHRDILGKADSSSCTIAARSGAFLGHSGHCSAICGRTVGQLPSFLHCQKCSQFLQSHQSRRHSGRTGIVSLAALGELHWLTRCRGRSFVGTFKRTSGARKPRVPARLAFHSGTWIIVSKVPGPNWLVNWINLSQASSKRKREFKDY